MPLVHVDVWWLVAVYAGETVENRYGHQSAVLAFCDEEPNHAQLQYTPARTASCLTREKPKEGRFPVSCCGGRLRALTGLIGSKANNRNVGL